VDSTAASFNLDKQSGTFIVARNTLRPRKILDETGYTVWSPEAQLFMVYTDKQTLGVKLNGEIVKFENALATATLRVSPDGKFGAWLATQKNPGVYVGPVNETPKQVYNRPTFWLEWVNNSQFFAYSDDLYIHGANSFAVTKVTEKVKVKNARDLLIVSQEGK
jgi:hypothetical protein